MDRIPTLTLEEVVDYLKFKRDIGWSMDEIIKALENDERGLGVRQLTKYGSGEL